MPSTGAGKYNTRITVKKPSRSTNDFNESVPTYEEVYTTVWAYVVPSSAREFTAAQQTNGMVAAIVRVRSYDKTRAITNDMRIEIGSRILNIGGIYDETNSRREVVIWCTEES